VVTLYVLHSFSLNIDNGIDSKGAVKLSEALESNSSLTSAVTNIIASCNSLITDSGIGSEGAIKLSEALKLNSSLKDLNLRCNKLLLQFIQGTIKLSEALTINTSLNALDRSGNRFICFVSSANTDNNIGGKEAIKLSEALKSNSSLTDLDFSCNILFFHLILTKYRQ
jgi:hypothetical protein